MAAYRDKTGRWRWRARARNPFTGQEARLTGSSPSSLNTRKAAEEDERGHVQAFVADPAARKTAASAMTLEGFVTAHYRPWMIIAQKAASTIEARESHLEQHILPVFGHEPLPVITKQAIKAFIVGLLTSAKKSPGGGERSVLTVRTIISTLRSILARAVDDDFIPAVPPFPKLPEVTKTDPNFLEYFEEGKVLAAAADAEERALFLVAIRCGLRAGEQKALRWEDISFERKTVRIERALVRGQLKCTKGRATRTVDLDGETIDALRAIRHLKPLVFSQTDGAALTYQQLETRLVRALVRAGIGRHVRWHDLRHSFGSHLAIAGVPLLTIRDLMGHQSVKTTEIYAHLVRKNGRDAIEMATRARAQHG
jgi:integrase